MKNDIEILRQSGCFGFLDTAAEQALAELERARPALAALLTEEARDCIRRGCTSRLEQLFAQPLLRALKEKTAASDPVGAVLKREDPEIMRRAAEELARSADGRMGELLRERYPLAADYEAHILRNFRTSWEEFFDALAAHRDEITARLLGGRAFTRIERFSDAGADRHRHGRAVTGVWTDAGAFYYKPHDCGLDALYHEIVTRWFSDCTVAADVVEGDGTAFVSCLTAAPVASEEDIAAYYRHFGMLTALLHGLGSGDIHAENVMPCGVRPTVIDLETIIMGSVERSDKARQLDPSRHALGHSVYRIGVLPARMYQKPMVSPLYDTPWLGSKALPEYDGKRYSVEGYEELFLQGFREGYDRLLAHRDEIGALIQAHGGATVRVLMRNTVFYAIIQRKLYAPEALQSAAARDRALHALSVPFESMGAEVFREEVDYEAACLKQGDIPYFCAAVDSRDLCGESREQLVSRDYYTRSAAEATLDSLARLSEEERRFEEDVIRVSFAQAPLDAPKGKTAEPPAETPLAPEDARAMAAALFRSLKNDALHLPGGGLSWLSPVTTLRGSRPCGMLSAAAEAGAFCALAIQKQALPELRGEAMEIARGCMEQIERELAHMELDRDWSTKAKLPLGLVNGLGGVLVCCGAMDRAGVPGASECVGRILRILREHETDWHTDATAAEGLAGLLLGLASLPGENGDSTFCLRLCAGRLASSPLPDKPDAAYGCAGIGAALAEGYRATGDERCVKKAQEAFEAVRTAYDPALRGWPDSKTKLRWMADRGPQAAGIALAADYAAGRLDSELPGELRVLALESLADEALKADDTLDEGNALAVLCLMRTGDKKRAGQLLEAMRLRAGRTGAYAVCPEGIRSFFDPSLWMGSLGVGAAALRYLVAIEDGRQDS